MKKLALALVASTVVAGSALADISTGFYLGAHTGWDNARADITATAPGGIPGKEELGRDNPNIGLFAGYGMVNGCFYWGGELGYTFASIKMRDSLLAVAGNLELKRSGYFNVALRLGYLFSKNTMGYVRLGGNWGKWQLRDSAFAGTVASPLTGSKNRFSFAPGLGLETALNRNVLLRAEWTYEFASSVRATNAAAAALGFRINASSIRSNSFKVGIAYKF